MTTDFPLPYAVCGVTGRTGAAAADALLRAGQAVRVVVRDPAQGHPWSARGAQVAIADLADLASMTRAFSGIRGAYVLCPQHYSRADMYERAGAIADTIARAALAAAAPRLVALSSVGADRDSATGWIAMNSVFEQRLADTAIPTTRLRAAYFMENWAPMVAHAVRNGTLPTFLAPPHRPLPMVATADVGTCAAALLQEEGMAPPIVTLAGPSDYAPADVAAILSATVGKPVDVAAVPEAGWATALADAHFSPSALAGFTDMTRGLNSGHIGIDSDPRAVHRKGTTPLERVIAGLARHHR